MSRSSRPGICLECGRTVEREGRRGPIPLRCVEHRRPSPRVRKGPRIQPLEERIRRLTVDLDGCTLWRGHRDRYGYGTICISKRTRAAHRVAYELVHGPISAGMQIDHLCCNPACVNPDHMEVVTQAENMRRRAQRNEVRRQRVRLATQLRRAAERERRERDRQRIASMTPERKRSPHDEKLSTVGDLRRAGYGYKRIANELGISRDLARHLVRRTLNLTGGIAGS